MGLRLSPDKTLITHIDEGLDFLGWRIQRHRKRGTTRHYVYVYPAKKAAAGRQAEDQDAVSTGRSEPAAGRPAASAEPDAAGLVRLLPARGVLGGLRLPVPLHVADGLAMAAAQTPQSHLEASSAAATAAADGGQPANDRELFDPRRSSTTRYRYRGAVIPSPWPATDEDTTTQPDRVLRRARCIERCTPGSGSGPGKRTSPTAGTAPRADFTDRPHR